MPHHQLVRGRYALLSENQIWLFLPTAGTGKLERCLPDAASNSFYSQVRQILGDYQEGGRFPSVQALPVILRLVRLFNLANPREGLDLDTAESVAQTILAAHEIMTSPPDRDDFDSSRTFPRTLAGTMQRLIGFGEVNRGCELERAAGFLASSEDTPDGREEPDIMERDGY